MSAPIQERLSSSLTHEELTQLRQFFQLLAQWDREACLETKNGAFNFPDQERQNDEVSKSK